MSAWIWAWTPEISDERLQERADVALLQAYQHGAGKFLEGVAEKAPPLSRSQLHQLMKQNQVRADGKKVSPGGKLIAGNEIRIEIPAPKTLEITPEDRPIDILFQDEKCFVIKDINP